jgi:hypothetical protein
MPLITGNFEDQSAKSSRLTHNSDIKHRIAPFRLDIFISKFELVPYRPISGYQNSVSPFRVEILISRLELTTFG